MLRRQLIGAAAAIENLLPMGNTPANEAQARALAEAPPAQRAEVWAKAVETAPDLPLDNRRYPTDAMAELKRAGETYHRFYRP